MLTPLRSSIATMIPWKSLKMSYPSLRTSLFSNLWHLFVTKYSNVRRIALNPLLTRIYACYASCGGGRGLFFVHRRKIGRLIPNPKWPLFHPPTGGGWKGGGFEGAKIGRFWRTASGPPKNPEKPRFSPFLGVKCRKSSLEPLREGVHGFRDLYVKPN